MASWVAAGLVGLVGSNFALARYNSDGTLDPSFGTGGTVTTDFAGGDDSAHALAVQADGKLVAAGEPGGSSPSGGRCTPPRSPAWPTTSTRPWSTCCSRPSTASASGTPT
jgi:hypothetical protein